MKTKIGFCFGQKKFFYVENQKSANTKCFRMVENRRLGSIRIFGGRLRKNLFLRTDGRTPDGHFGGKPIFGISAISRHWGVEI